MTHPVSPTKAIRLLFVAMLWVGSAATHAAIIYDSATSTSNSFNVTDPGTTNSTAAESLWNEVAQVRESDGITSDASAVYLGDGFLLTANHVTGTRFFLGGIEYTVDTSFGTNGSKTILDSQNQALDLKLIKLATLPNLPGIDLLSSTDTATGQFSEFIGWGVGKGSLVSGQGWTWGGSDTARERWGLNYTNGTTTTVAGNPNIYLSTTFNRSNSSSLTKAQIPDLFSLTLGDSGGGLFQLQNGVWKLAGIAAGVSTTESHSYYDNSSPFPVGDQSPDQSYFIDLQAYSANVLEAMGSPAIPEASSLTLCLWIAAGLLLWRLRLHLSRFTPRWLCKKITPLDIPPL